MKTATLILTTAVVAATLFSCGKKDDGGGQAPITLSKSAMTITEGQTEITTVAAPAGLKKPISSNESIVFSDLAGGNVNVKIIGKKEGSANVTILDKAGNTATISVTDWGKKGSGNYTVSTPNTSVVREAGKKNGRLYAIGLSEGSNSEIVFKDIDKNEEVRVPVYVIAPFTAVGVPVSMTANDVQTLNLTGVYSTTAVDGRHDRVTITANNGKAEATLVTRDVRNNVGQVVAKITTGIKITAKEAGEAIIQLTNGDGQSLEIKFTVTAYVANNYFNVDADGVLTIKPGVRLPAEVVLPSNAKKVAKGVFEGQTQIQQIDFNNVTEIEGPLYTTDSNGYIQQVGNLNKVILRKVEKIGYNAFAHANNLKVVEFPATLKFLGQAAFLRCNAIRAVAFRGTTPPVGINNNGNVRGSAGAAFDNTAASNRRLFVPESSKEDYLTALGSSNFAYRPGPQPVNWYSGDTHQAIVDIANFDKVDLSKL